MRRLVLIVVSTFPAALAGRDAALAYWRIQETMAAPKVFAADPVLSARRAEHYLSDAELFSARAGAVGSNALAALRNSPLDAIAMRQLGMVAARQQADAGSAHWAAAERITRRDLSGQLLLIEKSAQDGDIAAALAHYDRALLTYPASSQQLYPVLAKALSDPEIRSGLKIYAKRSWIPDFLGKAIELGGDPVAVTGMIADVRAQLAPRDTQLIVTTLIGQLVARGRYAAVCELVRQMPAGASRAIDQIALSPATSDPQLAPLTWALVNDGSFETALDAKGGLAVSVASERSGAIAQRVTLLAPGRYEFTQVVSYASGTPHAALSWNVRCLGDATSRPIWQQQLPLAAGDTTYRSAFAVPEDCTAQSWQLAALAAETQFASTATISGLSLVKR
jgi:hypothetical protein